MAVTALGTHSLSVNKCGLLGWHYKTLYVSLPVGEREAAEGDGCEGGEAEQREGGQGHARQEN